MLARVLLARLLALSFHIGHARELTHETDPHACRCSPSHRGHRHHRRCESAPLALLRFLDERTRPGRRDRARYGSARADAHRPILDTPALAPRTPIPVPRPPPPHCRASAAQLAQGACRKGLRGRARRPRARTSEIATGPPPPPASPPPLLPLAHHPLWRPRAPRAPPAAAHPLTGSTVCPGQPCSGPPARAPFRLGVYISGPPHARAHRRLVPCLLSRREFRVWCDTRTISKALRICRENCFSPCVGHVPTSSANFARAVPRGAACASTGIGRRSAGAPCVCSVQGPPGCGRGVRGVPARRYGGRFPQTRRPARAAAGRSGAAAAGLRGGRRPRRRRRRRGGEEEGRESGAAPGAARVAARRRGRSGALPRAGAARRAPAAGKRADAWGGGCGRHTRARAARGRETRGAGRAPRPRTCEGATVQTRARSCRRRARRARGGHAGAVGAWQARGWPFAYEQVPAVSRAQVNGATLPSMAMSKAGTKRRGGAVDVPLVHSQGCAAVWSSSARCAPPYHTHDCSNRFSAFPRRWTPLPPSAKGCGWRAHCVGSVPWPSRPCISMHGLAVAKAPAAPAPRQGRLTQTGPPRAAVGRKASGGTQGTLLGLRILRSAAAFTGRQGCAPSVLRHARATAGPSLAT